MYDSYAIEIQLIDGNVDSSEVTIAIKKVDEIKSTTFHPYLSSRAPFVLLFFILNLKSCKKNVRSFLTYGSFSKRRKIMAHEDWLADESQVIEQELKF